MALLIGSGLVIFLVWAIILGIVGSYKQWSFEEVLGVDGNTILFITLILKGVALSVYFSLHIENVILSVASILWILLEAIFFILVHEVVINKEKTKLVSKIYEKVFLPIFNDKDTIAYIKLKPKINHWTFSGLEDYEDIQAMIRYVSKKEKFSNFKYNEFVARVFFGYSGGDIFTFLENSNEYLWINNSFGGLPINLYGLRYRDWVNFSALNYDDNEREIIATKYLTAFQTIQSLIGLKPDKEVRARVIELFDTYAKELSEGVVEIRETEERMKQEERMVYEKQQERLKELMDNVLKLYKKT